MDRMLDYLLAIFFISALIYDFKVVVDMNMEWHECSVNTGADALTFLRMIVVNVLYSVLLIAAADKLYQVIK